MRIGMYVDMRNAPQWRRPWSRHYGQWLERIAEADRLGADMVWLTEHHFFDDGYLPQCWTWAAAIAAHTSRIRIGSAVALLPLHTAIELAEQIALVDIISDGRVEPGFGVGYRKPEYQAFGGEFKRRYGVYAERIRELRRLWGEEPGAERTVTPPPVQHPIPLWGGFGGPMGARTAGRLGLGLQSIDRSLLDPYQEGLAAGGFGADRARLAGSIEFIVSDDPERTRAQLAPHVAYRYESYNRYMFEGTRHKTDQPPHFDPRALTDRLVVGTAEQVAAEIRTRVAGMPVTDVYSWSDYPGIDDEVIDRHIELTFREVAPLLRD